jgi:hypothetical protein
MLAFTFLVSLIPALQVNAEAAGTTSGYWTSYASATAPELDGTTYKISSAEELAWVAKQYIATKNTFEGYTIEITNNIDLSAHYWTPISIFKGTFLGGSNSGLHISNMSITGNNTVAGLFAILQGSVRNVCMTDINIEVTSDSQYGIQTGPLAGVLANGGAAENSTASGRMNINYAPVLYADYASANIGGLMGNISGTVLNCSSNVEIILNQTNGSCQTGGLSGSVYGTVSNCDSYGTIQATINGVMGQEDTWGNNGVGGLFGNCLWSHVENCSSHVTIGVQDNSLKGNWTFSTGGFAGNFSGGYALSSCSAEGLITVNSTANDAYVGGFVGIINNNNVDTSNCYATCDVQVSNNSGDISAGGFAGQYFGDINSCYAIGNVQTSSDTGGILAGGLAGEAGQTMSLCSDCLSKGNVTATSVSGNITAGGLFGNSMGSVTNSYSTGNGHYSTTSGEIIAGGMCGKSFASLKNSYATGNISCENNSWLYLGGLVGDNSGTIGNSYAFGLIQATGNNVWVGGIAGTSGNYDCAIKNCYWNQALNPALIGVFNTGNGTVEGILGLSGDQCKCLSTLPTFSVNNTDYSNKTIVEALNIAAAAIPDAKQWQAGGSLNNGYPVFVGALNPVGSVTFISPTAGSTITSLPATLQWAPVTGASEYRLYMNNSSTPNFTSYSASMSISLISGSYTIRIEAYDAAGQKLASGSVSFTVDLPPDDTPYTVTGIVLDDISGAPIAGASVQCGSITVTTSADGTFILQNLTRGIYTISVLKEGFTSKTGIPVFVIGNGTIPAVRLVPSGVQTINITGTVYRKYTDQHEKVTYANVCLNGSADPRWNTTTDGSGNFSFTGIAPGTLITVTKVGYDAGTATVQVNDNQNSILIEMPYTQGLRTVAGRVVNMRSPETGIPGVTVELVEQVDSTLLHYVETTDPDGYYQIKGVGENGISGIRFSKSGYVDSNGNTVGCLDFSGPNDANPAPADAQLVDMNGFYRISGTVRNRQGHIVQNAVVSIKDAVDFNAVTDDNGNFTILGVAGGLAWSLVAEKDGFKGSASAYVSNTDKTGVGIVISSANDVGSVYFNPADQNLTFDSLTPRQIVACVSPETALNKSVLYSSSNTSVATVDNTGLVTPMKTGTAKITATTVDGGYKATCNITVTIASQMVITTPSLENCFALQAYDVTLTGTGGTAPYRWSVNGLPGGLSFSAPSGSITGMPAQTGVFNVSIILRDALNNSVSQTFVLRSYSSTTPVISRQPYDLSVTAGDDAIVSVTASGSGTLSYQWYWNSTRSSSAGTAIPGANASNYHAPANALGTGYYYCIIINSYNDNGTVKESKIYSSVAAVTVGQPQTAGNITCDNPDVLAMCSYSSGSIALNFSDLQKKKEIFGILNNDDLCYRIYFDHVEDAMLYQDDKMEYDSVINEYFKVNGKYIFQISADTLLTKTIFVTVTVTEQSDDRTWGHVNVSDNEKVAILPCDVVNAARLSDTDRAALLLLPDHIANYSLAQWQENHYSAYKQYNRLFPSGSFSNYINAIIRAQMLVCCDSLEAEGALRYKSSHELVELSADICEQLTGFSIDSLQSAVETVQQDPSPANTVNLADSIYNTVKSVLGNADAFINSKPVQISASKLLKVFNVFEMIQDCIGHVTEAYDLNCQANDLRNFKQIFNAEYNALLNDKLPKLEPGEWLEIVYSKDSWGCTTIHSMKVHTGALADGYSYAENHVNFVPCNDTEYDNQLETTGTNESFKVSPEAYIVKYLASQTVLSLLCPITVSVYYRGNLLVTLNNEKPVYLENEYGLFYSYYADGELVKKIVLYNPELQIVVNGTDTGTMSVYVANASNHRTNETITAFEDIPVTSSAVIMTDSIANTQTFDIDQNGDGVNDQQYAGIQYEIQALSSLNILSALYQNSKVTITVELTNDSQPATGVLLAAVYDSSGRLVGIASREVTIPSGPASYSMELSGIPQTNAKTVKVFLIDSGAHSFPIAQGDEALLS